MSAPAAPADLAARIDAGDASRRALRDHLKSRRAALPLRYWRQEAHLTAPAADGEMARKALEGGTAPVKRMLDRLDLSVADLAMRLEIPTALVEERLDRPCRAPLVMLDGEDAIAPGDAAAARGVQVAVSALTSGDPGTGKDRSLRFYRPPGFNLETTVRDVYTLLAEVKRQTPEGTRFPLDGLVFPKIEHPEEVDLVNELLDHAEGDLSLDAGSIRVAYLVEGGWAAARLAEIAQRAAPRLAGLIFGLADFSADLGLPSIGTNHPLAVWARAEIVAVAGAVGVPAIDGMTLDYPVTDPALGVAANRARWLDRMRLVFDDAVAAQRLGMSGKWVGHPAQLLAVLLAWDVAIPPDALDAEAAKLEAYEAALAMDDGATMIGGVMSDRATDRHARVLLRRATAQGRFDPARAIALGVVDKTELEDAGLVSAVNPQTS